MSKQLDSEGPEGTLRPLVLVESGFTRTHLPSPPQSLNIAWNVFSVPLEEGRSGLDQQTTRMAGNLPGAPGKGRQGNALLGHVGW